jgi:hypothetical protein
VTPYDIIRWEKLFTSFFKISVSYLIQTLTSLNLQNNQIGAQGAKHMCDGLRQNKVKDLFFSSSSHWCFLFNIDINFILSCKQSNRRWWCTTFMWCITAEFGRTSSLLISNISFFYLTQSIAHLLIGNNQIGAQGTRYLSEALKHNTVRIWFYFYVSHVSFFGTDSRLSQP